MKNDWNVVPRIGNAPCKNCTDRTLGCHDRCEYYKAYKADLKKRNDYLTKKTSPSAYSGRRW